MKIELQHSPKLEYEGMLLVGGNILTSNLNMPVMQASKNIKKQLMNTVKLILKLSNFRSAIMLFTVVSLMGTLTFAKSSLAARPTSTTTSSEPRVKGLDEEKIIVS